MKIRKLPLWLTVALMLIPSVFPGAEEQPFPMQEVSSQELLEYAEERTGIAARHDEFMQAAGALRQRIEDDASPYLAANTLRVNAVLAAADLHSLRRTMESNLYSYQQDPLALIQEIRDSHWSSQQLKDLPDGDSLTRLSQENITIGLYLLAIFGAYDLSLGEWDQALETLELYQELPDGASAADIQHYEKLLAELSLEITRYEQSQKRLPIPEFFVASTGFGIAIASAADLIIPGFQIPFIPGDSPARTAALTGTIFGGSLIGFSAIVLPPLVRQNPLEPFTDFLSDTWGHLIEGSLQIFEDNRHRTNQLIILSLIPNRHVVFPDSTEPRELPAAFGLERPGRFRIQVQRGMERISTPTHQLHHGINLVPLIE
ncbi:MAG: hypothetical protein ACOC0D_05865 [Spirochaeta sp.]